MCHHLLKIKPTQMSVAVHLPFICTGKLKLWNTLWILSQVYWRWNMGRKKFTYIDSFFVHGSFLRLLDVPFSFYSKCACLLIIIINEVFVLLCYVEALTKPGVPWCWMVGQTQITVHALENSQMNWKVWSYKVQRASCKPLRHLDVCSFQWELGNTTCCRS